MMRSALILSVLLSGCGIFAAVDRVKEKVQGLTNPMVGQALILGVEEPADPSLDELLVAAGFAPGTTANAFLADAKSSSAADEAPVTGALVELVATAPVPLEDLGEGSYALAPEDGPTYQEGAVWDLFIDVGEEQSRLGIELPPAAEVGVPSSHVTAADMVLDFTGLGFQSALIFVIDGAGQLTWTNEPQTTSEAIDFAGGDDDMEVFVIPGVDAFPTDSIYAVGIAGLRSNEPTDIENMNTALSNLQAGRLRWQSTSTIPLTGP